MLVILDSPNYGGKDSTIEIIRRKRKNWLYAYHPRFLDKYYNFSYSDSVSAKHIDIPGDIVRQISHSTIMSYLQTFNSNNTIVLNRSFISEMVYNQYHDPIFYEGLCNILKEKFDYHIYYLFVSDEQELKKRIKQRFEEDRKKSFGDSVGKNHDLHSSDEEEAIVNRFNLQRSLDSKYRNVLTKFDNNVTIIDTAFMSKKDVAKIIGDKK